MSLNISTNLLQNMSHRNLSKKDLTNISATLEIIKENDTKIFELRKNRLKVITFILYTAKY